MAETPEQREAFIRRVIEEADAEIRAGLPEPEPHYLQPVQAPLFPSGVSPSHACAACTTVKDGMLHGACNGSADCEVQKVRATCADTSGVSVDRAADLEKLLTQILNRRVAVEQRMFDAASGKRPMPTADELRQWAIELGTPASGVAVPHQPKENHDASSTAQAPDVGVDVAGPVRSGSVPGQESAQAAGAERAEPCGHMRRGVRKAHCRQCMSAAYPGVPFEEAARLFTDESGVPPSDGGPK